jgi:hypothetical protein
MRCGCGFKRFCWASKIAEKKKKKYWLLNKPKRKQKREKLYISIHSGINMDFSSGKTEKRGKLQN